MHSLFFALAATFLAVTLSACAAGNDGRLEALEGKARDQRLFELRLTHLEERMVNIEAAIGELKEQGTVVPAEKKRRTGQSTDRSAASPVVLGTVELAGGAPVKESAPGPTSGDSRTFVSLPSPPPVVGVGTAPRNDPFAGLTTVPVVPDNSPKSGGRPVSPRPVHATPATPRASYAVTKSSVYNAAYALYEKGDYAGAQRAFADFAAASPGDSLVPNAIYWQGECQYSLRKYDSAIFFFQDVINKYPNHAKAAAALLKAGYSYERLNDMANARFYWQILIDDFPKSAPAALARKRLGG